MIKSFASKDTELLFKGYSPNTFRSIKVQAERKLQMLDSATSITFLRSPPGNRLEKLSGDRQGAYSIRVNDRFRLCFCFIDGDAFDVEIVDYH